MFYKICDFMYEDLNLIGTDLNVFAIIYSSKEFYGSLETLRKRAGVKSVSTIKYSLKRLLERGLISKQEPKYKGRATCTYTSNYFPKNKKKFKGESDFSNKETVIGVWD